MKATEILMEEHTVIIRVLDALEKAGNAPDVQPGFYIQVSDFIRGFADGCHHRKEENVLFKAMSQSGVPVEGGPIGMMLAEHQLGREYTQAMRSGAQKWESGDPAGRREAAEAAYRYSALLRQHILKENHVLFPMADRFIPSDAQGQVAEDFERMEHEETGEGIHEKYLALVNTLEAQARDW
jgi:hemerythrin-like domain-containing protein